MSSKNERKKGLGRGLSSFLDADSFEGFVDKENDKESRTAAKESSRTIQDYVRNHVRTYMRKATTSL